MKNRKQKRRTHKHQIREHPQNMRLGNMFDDLCNVYNHFLKLEQRYYRIYGKYAGRYRLQPHLTKLIQRTHQHWAGISRDTLDAVIIRIDTTYQRFFDGLCGLPKFKRKDCYRFAILILLVLHVSVSLLFAKAPTTPKILFTSARDGNYDIYTMNPDGSEQVNLTQHRAADVDAVWSPSGDQILFVSDREGVRDLYLMDPDTSKVQRVFKKDAYRDAPTWSPDGKQIAYTYADDLGAASFIYIATLGKQKEELLVRGFFPAWSPDGTEIAYVTYVPIGHDRRVTLVDIRTRKQKRVLPKEAMEWQNHPSWSKTGDKLIFSWNKHPLPPDFNPLIDRFPPAWRNKETIYIVNRDGTDLQQLVDEAGPYAQYSKLSPNGEEVLYTQEINGDLQIFKLNVNSGVRTQLTDTSRNMQGDWFDPAFALPVSPQPQLLTTTWGKVKRR